MTTLCLNYCKDGLLFKIYFTSYLNAFVQLFCLQSNTCSAGTESLVDAKTVGLVYIVQLSSSPAIGTRLFISLEAER